MSILKRIRRLGGLVKRGELGSYLAMNKELKRLSALPRFQTTTSDILGHPITIPDTASFLFIKQEIFEQEIYRFSCTSAQPYIIDCGANIGMSVIYFKKLFPNATVVAFEPDQKIYDILQSNVASFKLTSVDLHKKACWNAATVLKFYSEGADGGRTADGGDKDNVIEVDTIRLKDFINRKIDFLKIDIEGAETEVIKDISDVLFNVDRIFVEYHSFVGKEQHLPEILNVLKQAGFRLHISSPGLVSKHPFIKFDTYANMDNQLNIYGTRH